MYNYGNDDQAGERKPLQEKFLCALKSQKIMVAVYLTNGIKLQGLIIDYDNHVLILKNQLRQKVYKHAIATIVPSRNVSLSGGANELESFQQEVE
jgi:host factor-I protein